MKSSFFLIPLFLLAACSTTKPVHPTLQATLWVQNAVEYDALTSMAYQTASTKIEGALADKSWTAELTQAGKDIKQLPPAIVLDIDETVLDNSPFQARMIGKNSGYDPVEWEKWVLEGNADAIAGAVELTKKAADAGITVIYLSNREANTEEATRKNLEESGFPISKETDVVLLKGEQENWTSSKIERRLWVASRYRILMLFGDDFNDFLPAKNITEVDRDALLEKHRSNFGEKWFIIPNPIYGSWNDAMFNFDRGLNEEEKQTLIKEHLNLKN
tara:strand:+ start:11499 stop:12320 length:822 start_codon:yes stop_codon:yes gene_type:complete